MKLANLLLDQQAPFKLFQEWSIIILETDLVGGGLVEIRHLELCCNLTSFLVHPAAN
jgi:hypothetical protein